MLFNYRELRQMYDHLGPAVTVQNLTEAFEQGHITHTDFSIKQLAEAFMGREWVNDLNPRRGSFTVVEAGNAVDSSAFSNITGQIVYNALIAKYNSPEFIGDDLMETVPTTFSGEKIAGVGRLGDEAEVVDEGQPYPTIGFNEEWIETPQTTKRGFIVPVTREAIFFDRTGQVTDRAGEGGYWIRVPREKEQLDCVFGVTNTYKRNGTTFNTYQTSGAYVNQQTKSLTDWTSIESAELLLDAITDPNTGEPVALFADTVIVPSALLYTARRVLRATSLETVDNQANAGTARMTSTNPVASVRNGQEAYRIISSRYVKNRTGSATTWFAGSPRNSFMWMENWGPTVVQAAANSEAEFNQDIVLRFKASLRGRAAVRDPRHMTKNV